MTVAPVTTRGDLAAFVDLPRRLYRRAPGWTPGHRATDLRVHDPARGPFFAFGEAQAFLARQGRDVRGRITAHVNHAYNAHHGTRVGGFGFLDTPPDPALVGPLLEAAERWVRGRGMTEIWGPLDFCLYDRVGLQVEGFDRPLPMSAAHHPAGMAPLVEAAGYRKLRDALTYAFPPPRAPLPPMRRVVAARRLAGLTIRRFSPRHRSDERTRIARIIDRAFGGNWLHFPIPEAVIRFQAEELSALLGPRNVLFAERDGEPVGAFVVVPDLGPLLRATGGRLLPWAIPGLWRQVRWPRELLVVVLAVVPECQTLGVSTHLLDAAIRSGIQHRCERVYTTFVDEGNAAMVNTLRRFRGTIHARHRIFAKPL